MTKTADRILIDSIRKAYARRNYRFFENGLYNLNLFGIRSIDTNNNSFNDTIGLIYRKKDDFVIDLFRATTDAGLYWLKNPMRVDGTAILIPDQYRGAWIIGKHKGYTALVQHEKSGFKVWRDKNRDGVVDKGGKVYDNVTGLNCHRARQSGSSRQVDKWSAGCQVINNGTGDATWDRFIKTILKSSETYGVYFTYTLFDETEIIV